MNNWLKQLKENFDKVWQSFSKVQKASLIGVSIASILLIIFLAVLSNRIVYEPLFTELESKDAATVKEYLDKKTIKYKITNDGTTIEVDKNAKYGIRLDISKQGLMPTNGTVDLKFLILPKLELLNLIKK